MKPLARRFDVEASRIIAKLPQNWHRSLSWLCFVVRPISWMFVAAVGLLLAILANDYSMSWLSAGVLLSIPLSEMIKLVFKRQRPESIYVEKTRIRSYSFPSGHAYSSALGCGYLIVALMQLPASAWLVWTAAGLVTLALVVAGSRIYLGAHFPTDVVAGLMLGTAVLLGLILAIDVPIGGLV